VIHVIVYQGLLGIAYRAFDRLKLLGDLKARLFIFDHGNNRAQMPLGTL